MYISALFLKATWAHVDAADSIMLISMGKNAVIHQYK